MSNIALGYFNKELSYIKDARILLMTEKAIDNLPEYFFRIPASSTGKYHPSFSLGEGGLYRHTTFAVGMAKELFNIVNFTPLEQDCIISALILHDGFKQGKEESGHTAKNHPLVMARFLDTLWDSYTIDGVDYKYIILDCIAKHMGKWDEKGVLPRPRITIEKFVHHCDYLASRRIYNDYYGGNDDNNRIDK